MLRQMKRVILLLVLSLPAAAQTVTVLDPAGDARFNSGNGVEAPDWLDILAADFTIEPDGSFELSITLAAPLVDLPPPSGESGAYFWSFGLDTTPGQPECGFPFSTGTCTPPEYDAFLKWDGSAFSGGWYDRLTGSRADIDAVADGDTVQIHVPAALAQSITVHPGARWLAVTVLGHNGVGSNGSQFADGTAWGSWPQ